MSFSFKSKIFSVPEVFDEIDSNTGKVRPTLLKKKSEFSLYFHFLGSDVRDHLFRSENRLILECSLKEKSECSLYFLSIFTLQRSDVRDFENSLFFFKRVRSSDKILDIIGHYSHEFFIC